MSTPSVNQDRCRKEQGIAEAGNSCLKTPGTCESCPNWSKSETLCFTVIGTPVPQGSTRAFIPKGWTRPIITAANSKTKPWRQEIAGVAENEIFNTDFKPLMNGEPVYIRAEFYFDKPKSAGKKVTHKVTKPDVDKLVRSLFDALTGIAFKDDAQVVDCEIIKRFGTPPRCEVRLGKVENFGG